MVEPGKAWAVYITGGRRVDLQLDLPEGVTFGTTQVRTINDELANMIFAGLLSIVFIYLLMGGDLLVRGAVGLARRLRIPAAVGPNRSRMAAYEKYVPGNFMLETSW